MPVFAARFCPAALLDYPPMKTFFFRILALSLFAASFASAQEVIPLYNGTPPGSTPENYPEKQYFSKSWNTEVVSNITKPSLTVFKLPLIVRESTAPPPG